MKKRGISQELLKTIACFTMLLDHYGAMFVRGYTLRIIGRIAFPIYCYLLAEGVYYTKDPKKYGIRLAIGMIVSEIPFVLALNGGFTWKSQSVMVTLLIAFVAVEVIRTAKFDDIKLVVAALSCALAQFCNTDYGGYGVLLVICLSGARGKLWMQGLIIIMFAWMMDSFPIPFLGMRVPIEMFAVLAIIPIALYNGKKFTDSRVLQTAFYFFYPVHLTLLYLLKVHRLG